MKPAWNNDTTSRDTALLRLTSALANDTINRNNAPFSILLQGEAPRDAEAILALPVTLAFLVDGVFLELPSAWGPEWGVETCQAMRANTDLYPVVGGVMCSALNVVRKLLEERIERGITSARVHAQLEVIEDTISICNRVAGGQAFDGSEPDIFPILHLSSHDEVNYIAKAALEAVIQVVVADQRSMLDADKAKNNLLRLSNSQSAGMSALTALRAVAQMVVDDVRQLTAASEPIGGSATIRLAEGNARVLFFDSMANAILQSVKEAPTFKRGFFKWGGTGKGDNRPKVRTVETASQLQSEPAALGEGVRD